jgi:GH43 family beta-xylosidase
MESFCLDANTYVCRGQRYFRLGATGLRHRGERNLYIARMLSPTRLLLPAALSFPAEYAWKCRASGSTKARPS